MQQPENSAWNSWSKVNLEKFCP